MTATTSRASPRLARPRMAGAYQDFFRFELRAQQSVGVGDLPRVDDPDAAAQP